MKIAYMLAALSCAASICAHAQSAAHNKLLEQFKGGSEKTAKDAIWTTPTIFKVGVIDNGSNRDGYAAYVCGEVASTGLTGISVQIIDIAKLKNTGKWVKLGEQRCG